MAKSRITELLEDSSGLIITGLVYFVVSEFIPQYNYLFNTHANLPWGVFTALFLYDGWTNILFFALCVTLFILSSYRLPEQSVKKRMAFATIGMFVIGVCANIYWVFMYPLKPGYGQSGVIFALYGIVFMFCALQVGFVFDDIKRGLRTLKGKDLTNSKASIIGLLIALVILLEILIEKGQFLNETYGVAYQVHAFSFLVGVVSGYAYFIVMRN